MKAAAVEIPEGTVVDVSITVEKSAAWLCPGCGSEKHHATIKTKDEVDYLRCRCGVSAVKGLEGSWHILDEQRTPAKVHNERSMTTQWDWKCPRCNHGNSVGLSRAEKGPLFSIKDNKRARIHAGPALRCWHCCLMILQDHDTGEWFVIEVQGTSKQDDTAGDEV